MNFTSQDYHTDRYREIYLSSAGWNRFSIEKEIEAADSDKIDEFLS